MNSSPWGEIECSTPSIDGCCLVKTASHGGLMVANDVAAAMFSEGARRLATTTNTHHCWEEDCAIWPAVYELLARHSRLANHLLFDGSMTPEKAEKMRDDALTAISRWNPEYLMDLGLDPLPGPYQKWQEARRYDEMLANKDPDLIVGTSNKKHDRISVACADGSMHCVTLTSYKAVMEKGATRLLSDCVLVEQAT